MADPVRTTDQVVDKDVIFNVISNNIGLRDYRNLGRVLGLNAHELDIVEDNARINHYNFDRKCLEILETWIKKAPETGWENHLLTALKQIQRMDLFNKITDILLDPKNYISKISSEQQNLQRQRKISVERDRQLKETFDIVCRNLSCRDWRPLARMLGLSSTEIDKLNAEYQSQTWAIQELFYQMFENWMQKYPNEAKVQNVERALRSIRRVDIAEMITSPLIKACS